MFHPLLLITVLIIITSPSHTDVTYQKGNYSFYFYFVKLLYKRDKNLSGIFLWLMMTLISAWLTHLLVCIN